MKRLEGRILLLKMKHCQRHNGPRLLSLRLELSLLLKKSSFSTFSLCPLLGDHLSHLVLLVHHHLNDNHHLSNGPTTYFVANMITAPNSLQLLHHLADPIGDLIAHIGHLPTSLLLHHHLNDDHQLSIISWY